MSDSVLTGRGGQPYVTARHHSGSSVDVYLFGATVTSFRTAAGREMLMVSEGAKFDGATPIRGGVPLVFPQFGEGAPLPPTLLPPSPPLFAAAVATVARTAA